MKRKEGYYWIRIMNHLRHENNWKEWEVAYYDKYGWYSVWTGGTYQDNELVEINETLIIRNEN